jgi:serine/threonine-protein kinase
MPEITPGTVIANRYTVGDRLGSGGMADVYLTHDSELGRNVALKVLHRRFSDDPGFVDRFRLEAQSAAGLQHPNVVSVFDRGDWDGTSWIAMEYLPGTTLKEVIRNDAPLDPARATRIALQVSQAVAFAHRAGVVHRDIKPQNVMIGPDDRATVTDFGIARAGAAGVTEAGSILGTAHYISPEQAQGQDAGPQADVYSIGIVLYEMLTGRVPFDAESPVAIAMQQVTAEPPPPSATVPGIPTDLEALTLQCLAKDPIIRPAGADELVVRLDSISERLRVSADPGATVAFGATAATTAMATAAAAGAVTAGGDTPPPEAPTNGEPSDGEDSKRKWWIAGGITAAVAIAGIALFLLVKPAPQITMPLVVGKDMQTATTIVSNAGFTSAPDIQKVQSNQPKGRVIKQNPLANAKVANDAKVTLTVSDGPGDVQIPTVADLKADEAQAKLEKLGFKVVVRQKASTDVAKGNAIGTDPAAGVSVVKGTEVTLFVSTGAAPIDVPDVTQQDVASARSTLQGAGFVVTTSNKETCDQTAGTVLSQSPSGGTKAAKGSTVSLVVTADDQCADIPAVAGQTQADATVTLTDAGFKVRTSGVGPNAVGTNPAEGTRALKGSTVTVTLGT